ncbi:MAG: GNAT family N-acetyltransferase [Chloroflexi bacterium]|nr:GNAT family N-acetyltransferase [Chloroflexota bacterium]MDA1145668.1 GNAT family N-acetyltransferase [Chloroflexota bacterium]
MTLRLATTEDFPAVRRCVDAAYRNYIGRIGRQPAPMTADYPALIARDAVHIAEDPDGSAAVAVFWREADHLYIDNLAVRPERQGEGIGSRLIEACEAHARSLGLTELRLYTNEAMTENLAFYPRRGFVETRRGGEDGFRRVYFSKQLAG